ncbi:MAG: hypothetical protein HQL20_04855 [Candidatus Omnitrophica bacterium]|nr:hypothetical protein [Candidatus Omnitrophota bacterium]
MNGRWILLFVLCFLPSCAVYNGPALQPEINSLVVADRLQLAAERIGAEESDYGPGNYLLYYLDRGLVEYYAGAYPKSLRSFEKAKQRFAELYTRSLSREALSWVANDYALPYRGADYEYVLVNVFQALNYLALGNVNEALVEARDLDSKYRVVEQLARAAKRSRFEDNGFARMFMGFVHEATNRPEDRDSARLFYQQAAEVYGEYYGGKYVPRVLQERLRDLDSGVDESGKAVVYVFQLAGFAPLKVPQIIPIPLDSGLLTQVVFPKFTQRYFDTRQGQVTAVSSAGVSVRAATELGLNIGELAVKDLESRKALVLTKAVLRPALKYLVERKQKENIQKQFGRPAAEIFGLFSSLYNVYSEQADLRSWQALPAEIRVARLVLDPGKYRLRFEHTSESAALVESDDLGEQELLPGQTCFLVTRGRR